MRPSLARPHMCYAMRSPTACADRHDAYLPSTRTFHTCEDDDEGEEMMMIMMMIMVTRIRVMMNHDDDGDDDDDDDDFDAYGLMVKN